MGGLHHPNGPKADPHVCSDMWLTGAPLHNPKPGTYNTVGLDQVIALHTKQYCRQPSLVLSIDAGTGYLSRTGTISYNLDGRPDPGREQSAPRVRPAVPRRPRPRCRRSTKNCSGGSNWWTPWRRARVRSTSSWAQTDRDKMDQYMTSLDEVEARLVASEKWIDIPLKKQDYSHLNLDATNEGDPGRVLPQHVRPDRACLRRRHHADRDLHAEPRGRHGHQRHVPAEARAFEDAPQSVPRHGQSRASWISRSTTCS